MTLIKSVKSSKTETFDPGILAVPKHGTEYQGPLQYETQIDHTCSCDKQAHGQTIFLLEEWGHRRFFDNSSYEFLNKH